MTTRRRILITGASSGLGRGMAMRFADLGRDLALCARRAEQLDELAGALGSAHPGRMRTAALDVTDHDAVFEVFEQLRSELGGLDRVVINAGVGHGRHIGTGGFAVNRQTLETNLVAALAQAEAAMAIFTAQGEGHLVFVSSFSALRGLPGPLAAYAASKAGMAALAEGIRSDVHGTPIKVTTLFPGYMESGMNPTVEGNRLLTRAEPAARALVDAIEGEPATAYVPTWPWLALSPVMRLLPAPLLKKFT